MAEITIPCACTIAGSDSGAGAGIQADLKTFSALDTWGVTVITAVTAQNTMKVKGIWPLPPEAVHIQMESVLEDFPIKAIGYEGEGTLLRYAFDACKQLCDSLLEREAGEAALRHYRERVERQATPTEPAACA